MAEFKFNNYLKRLPPEHYRENAYVHWSITIQNRRTGWLTATFYYRFREILTHTLFRYQLTCPVFCCMPDHIHLLWIGLSRKSDQLNAMKYFRRQINSDLGKIGFRLQTQGYDNVLSDDERQESSLKNVLEYVARNPERKGLVDVDQYASYAFTNCLIPGAPEVDFKDPDFWETFWRIHSASVKN